MAEETYELCLDGEGLRIIPVGEDQVSVHILADVSGTQIISGDRGGFVNTEEDSGLSTPLFLSQTQSILTSRDSELKPASGHKKNILQGISLYIEYGKEWVDDLLDGMSECSGFLDFPVYCQDGISWSNKLVLGSLNVKLKNILTAAGNDSCLVVPQVSKAEFDLFTQLILSKETVFEKETRKLLLKVGELFEFPIRYISLEERSGGVQGNQVVKYSSIFTQQREEFIHKISWQTDLAKFISKVSESEGVQRPSTPGQWGQVQEESENVDEGIEDERFYCDACGRSFLTDGMLQTHISIVHSVRPTNFRKFFPCPFCNKRFTFRPNVRKHAKLVHRKPIEQAVSPVPPAGLLSPTDFSPSVTPEPVKLTAKATKGMSQEGPLNALCKVCGKFSKNKRGLVQHMQVHYGRVFKCEVRGCKGSFTERSKLRRHMVVHTGERKFECPFCKTKFSLRHNLKVHVKIHERDEKEGRKLAIMDQGLAVDLKESKKMGKTSQEMADVDMSPTTEDIEMFIAAMEGEPIHI